jgi:hypothetical protein
MKNKNTFLIIGIIIVVLVIFGGIYFFNLNKANINSSSDNPVSVNLVLSNYNKYLDKEIVLQGKFGGWGVPPECNLSLTGMITKSDTMFSDDTGCIAMNARSETPISYNAYDIGHPLKIKARVILDPEGKPLLNVIEILS